MREEACSLSWCEEGHRLFSCSLVSISLEPMPMQPLGKTAGITNTGYDFWDVTLWHSSYSWYSPIRKPTTREPNNDFNNNRSILIPPWFKMIICLQRLLNAECNQHKCDTLSLGQLGKSALKKADQDWAKCMVVEEKTLSEEPERS